MDASPRDYRISIFGNANGISRYDRDFRRDDGRCAAVLKRHANEIEFDEKGKMRRRFEENFDFFRRVLRSFHDILEKFD